MFIKSDQNELINLGTQLAAAEGSDSENLPQLSDDAILKLESEIDTANELLTELTSFVLPGGSVINAQFHIARNVCRRAERRVVSLSKKENIDSDNILNDNPYNINELIWIFNKLDTEGIQHVFPSKTKT